MENQINISVGYRWLGMAGIELRAIEQSLLIDPYFTRLPWQHILFRPVKSNRRLVKEMITGGDHILVTHAHIDHLLDVPAVVDCTDAPVYGSQNTCRLLHALGVAETKIHQIEAGDYLALGAFQVQVFSAKHIHVPGFGCGIVPADIKPPLTASQYRLDSCFTFLIEVNGLRVLVDSGRRSAQNLPADILIIHPFYQTGYSQMLLNDVRPQLVIPNHWDNFMAPFIKNDKPEMHPPDWITSLIRRVVLPRFSRTIKRYAPDVKVLIPQVFWEYDLVSLINPP